MILKRLISLVRELTLLAGALYGLMQVILKFVDVASNYFCQVRICRAYAALDT